jgi:RNA polymerase sigma-70 factor, ECF subfamily
VVVTGRNDDLSALVDAARKGDDGAFEALVRATHAETYTLAYRLTGDPEDARDVTQDTYLRAYRAIGSFRGDARFQTWLYRITANSASTLLGQRARHRHDELLEEASVADERIQIDPVAQAEGTSLRNHLTEALRQLPPGLRQVVVLRDVYDLPHDAIAEELGISVSAAKVRLHRARRRLRDDLYPRPQEENARAV